MYHGSDAVQAMPVRGYCRCRTKAAVDDVCMCYSACLSVQQVNHRDEWLECVRSAFDALDVDKDGRIKPGDVMKALKAKLPEAEVRHSCLVLGEIRTSAVKA